jgi:ribulose-5-phosphate 4-epimerase/fuculose-1-phosphate aldolase
MAALISGEPKYPQEIVSLVRMLHQRGNVAASDDNLSVHFDEQRILVAPAAISKGQASPDRLGNCRSRGRLVAGRRHLSSGISMHLPILQAASRCARDCARPFLHPVSGGLFSCSRNTVQD